MTDEIDPTRALDYIKKNSEAYGIAKGRRIYIENYLKSLKAILMAKVPPSKDNKDVSLGTKEMIAYSHPEYLEQLAALEKAVQEEEKLKYLLEGAKMQVEVYKVQEYTKRTELRNINVS